MARVCTPEGTVGCREDEQAGDYGNTIRPGRLREVRNWGREKKGFKVWGTKGGVG